MAKIPSYPALLAAALNQTDKFVMDHSGDTRHMTITEMNKQWATILALAVTATGAFTFIQSSTPSATQSGESWLDTDDGKVYVSSGTGTGNWGTFVYQLVLNEGNTDIGVGMTPVTKLDVNGEGRFSDGVLFGTDTAVANRLDDYEEGTWTPVPSFVTGTAASIATVTAKYVKIGNIAHVTFEGSVTKSTDTGNFTITGLPFTSDDSGQIPGAVNLSKIGETDKHVSISVINGSSILRFVLIDHGTSGIANLTDTAFGADPVLIRSSISYQTA